MLVTVNKLEKYYVATFSNNILTFTTYFDTKEKVDRFIDTVVYYKRRNFQESK